MRRLYFILVLLFALSSCEKYVTEISDITLSGKYVVSKLEITSVDQNTSHDSLYTIGSVYVNNALPDPFDSIPINHFYLHMDYSTIRLNQIGVTPTGNDIWQYGVSPNEIFYRVLGNHSYNNGFIQFDYVTNDGSSRTITFLIEDDGFESLQLKSEGAWFHGKYGEKQVMTLGLTRVGP